MIDVTMTATWRPELIFRTLKSFHDNLFKDSMNEMRLIVNIDPVGNDTDQSDEIVYIANDFFKEVKAFCPECPHFGKAVVRIWKETNTTFVFHLEEDWEMLYEMDFDYMMNSFLLYPDLVHLRLSVFRSTYNVKNWRYFYDWNGMFFQCPDEDRGTVGWCGHPSLNRGDFIRFCAEAMDPSINPEKQIKGRHPVIGPEIEKKMFGSFIMQNSPANIRDIGREWRVKHGYHKVGNQEWFTTWERR